MHVGGILKEVKGTKYESEREVTTLYTYMHIKERANGIGKGEREI